MAKGKTCGKCDRWKALERFSPMRDGRYGRHTYCKPCRSKENSATARHWRRVVRKMLDAGA